MDRLVTRDDDTEEVLRKRLDFHHKNMDRVVGYFSGKVI